MLYRLILFILIISFISCCDETDENIFQNDCIEILENLDWATENFKSDYTIQLPNNYEGDGMFSFEGNTFSRNRNDNKVILSYSFCDNGFFCFDFDYANPLELPIPNSIITTDSGNNEITLTLNKEFCLNDNIIGYFYSNTETYVIGKYYMLQNDIYIDGIDRYVEGLSVFYYETEYQEVQDIIKTILKN